MPGKPTNEKQRIPILIFGVLAVVLGAVVVVNGRDMAAMGARQAAYEAEPSCREGALRAAWDVRRRPRGPWDTSRCNYRVVEVDARFTTQERYPRDMVAVKVQGQVYRLHVVEGYARLPVGPGDRVLLQYFQGRVTRVAGGQGGVGRTWQDPANEKAQYARQFWGSLAIAAAFALAAGLGLLFGKR